MPETSKVLKPPSNCFQQWHQMVSSHRLKRLSASYVPAHSLVARLVPSEGSVQEAVSQ